MTGNVTPLFEKPETVIGFIDRLGFATADQIARRFGRRPSDVRKELDRLKAEGVLFSKAVRYSGWSDGLGGGGRVLVWATSEDRLPNDEPGTGPTG